MIKHIKSVKILICLFVILLFSVIPNKLFATNDFYSENNILFYSSESDCFGSISDSKISPTLTGYDRLKEAVRVYGETAMEMQREYGTPWEVVLAQMQMESQVGTDGIAVQGATNNWLGMVGSGDAGSWAGPSGREWAKYSSIEISIKDWAGPRVLRNGIYDEAFKSLDPNNYNLDSFLTVMLSHYAPNSDGNNENTYKQNVLSFINGPIAAVRTEKKWPSSAELAKTNNITVGGKYAIGSTIPKANYASNTGCLSAGNGDINKTAIELACPDRSHNLFDPKPEYKAALEATGVNKLGDKYSMAGASCDAFVTTVMRYSGADKDFPCCGVTSEFSYLSSSNKYQSIPNLGNTSNLQPGDIFILNEAHIMMYIKLSNGTEKIASASYTERTADYASGVYFSDWRGSYSIFRYIGGTK